MGIHWSMWDIVERSFLLVNCKRKLRKRGSESALTGLAGNGADSMTRLPAPQRLLSNKVSKRHCGQKPDTRKDQRNLYENPSSLLKSRTDR